MSAGQEQNRNWVEKGPRRGILPDIKSPVTPESKSLKEKAFTYVWGGKRTGRVKKRGKHETKAEGRKKEKYTKMAQKEGEIMTRELEDRAALSIFF